MPLKRGEEFGQKSPFRPNSRIVINLAWRVRADEGRGANGAEPQRRGKADKGNTERGVANEGIWRK